MELYQAKQLIALQGYNMKKHIPTIIICLITIIINLVIISCTKSDNMSVVIEDVEFGQEVEIIEPSIKYDKDCVSVLEYAVNNEVSMEQWEQIKDCQKRLILEPLESKEYAISPMALKDVSPQDVIKYHKQMVQDIDIIEVNGIKYIQEKSYEDINNKFKEKL